jgi:hypothetical protein
MSEAEARTESETRSRTVSRRSWALPGTGRGRWWSVPVALLVVAAFLATSVVVLTGGTRVVQEEWSSINLSLGSNPLSQQLNLLSA